MTPVDFWNAVASSTGEMINDSVPLLYLFLAALITIAVISAIIVSGKQAGRKILG